MGKPDTPAASWQLDERTRAIGTEWALGIAARSGALLSHGQAADTSYREAIERLARSRITVHLAASGPGTNCAPSARLPTNARRGRESGADRP